MMRSEPSYEAKLFLSLSKKQLLATCFIIFIFSTGLSRVFTATSPPGSPLAEWESISVSDEYYDSFGFSEVVFHNATHGWLLGSYALLQTTNGGDSWNPILGPDTRRFYDLSVVNPLNIWVSGGHLYHSLDGGETWQNVYTPEIGVPKIAFYNSSHGLVGDVDRLYRTFDGGISWTNCINWSSESNSIRDFCLTASAVHVATNYGFYLSDDWGLTWEVVDSRGTRGLSFISENEGWIIHYQSITHLVNDTLFDFPRVARLQVPSNSYYDDIEFIDSDHGWVVGIGPAVIYTPDGGNSWYEQECPDYHFRSVDFINETHGWAAGWRGAVARTVTGNLLGPHLPSGFIISLGFTGGGLFVPYVSVLVGTVSTMACVFLIFIIRRKILMNRDPHHEGVHIR